MAVGHDVRLTSPEITAALCRGLVASGVDVVDIGLVGTEEVYFATFALGVDGGIMVTASHNPREYNGMKFTRAQARPISADTGLFDIEEMVREAMTAGGKGRLAGQAAAAKPGTIEHKDMRPAFVRHLLTYIDTGGSAAAEGRGQPGQRRGGTGRRHARSRTCLYSS